MSSPSPLSIDVFVAPMRPFAGAPAQAPGDEPNWSPMSSTLISGATDAILVDTLVTFDQVDALADWVEAKGKNLTAIFITHGHQDHWIGLGRLLERFPNARGLATAAVLERAQFEATDPGLSGYWQAIFAGEIPAVAVLPELLEGESIELEGNELRIISIGQGDTEHSDVLYAPAIDAVVCGDVVYNRVHVMTAETDATSRAAWIDSLDRIAGLNPKIVVAGHKRVGAPDSPEILRETQDYLRDFGRVLETATDPAEVVAAMLALQPDRDNTRTLWHAARAAIAKKA